MKKVFALAVALCLVAVFSSCGTSLSSQDSSAETTSSHSSSQESDSQKMLDDTAIKNILTEKLPVAHEIYSIFSGPGLDYDQSVEQEYDENGRCFVPVVSDKYHSTQDIRNAAEQVFTVQYAQENFYQYALEGDYSRYLDLDGVLMMDIGQGGGTNLNNWDLESMAVKSQTEDTILLNMDFISDYDEAGNADLTLVKENGEWKFTSDFR